MPHGHCYMWAPAVLWLHVISDALIAAAYFTIPLTLLHFVRRRKDLQFDWMFVCFAVFILACGANHLMDIWTVWYPTYWLAGAIKALTALASIPTALLLMKLVPFALALPSPAKLAATNARLNLEIEERIRIERMLQLKNEELGALNDELTAFSYSVSHDLRAPLRSMDNFALVLLEDSADQLDGPGRDALRRIRLASQRMSALIDGLLRLSDVGRAALQRERVDASALCHEIATHLDEQPTAQRRQWDIAPGLMLDGDPALLRIVLQNLLENAWKFTAYTANAQIRVGQQDSANGSAFFVADNGAGFAMRYAERIFSAFQRLHPVADFPGTGIGLALVQRIVLRHGGRIWADATTGHGATFHFQLAQSAPATGALA